MESLKAATFHKYLLNVQPSNKTFVAQILEGSPDKLVHTTVVAMRKIAQSQSHVGDDAAGCICRRSLYDLLRGSEIVENPLVVPVPTAAQIEFKRKLQMRADTIEYNRYMYRLHPR